MEKTSTNKQHYKIIPDWSNRKCSKNRLEHVLADTQPLSYHFSHLGVNAFVATCQTPTCFEFTTRVLAPLPRSTGNTDKRAITVLLFRVPHELLTFWRTWQGSLFFFPLTPRFDDEWPTTSSERGQRRPADSTIFPSRRGANWANITLKWVQLLHPYICSQIQTDLMCRQLHLHAGNREVNNPFCWSILNVQQQKKLTPSGLFICAVREDEMVAEGLYCMNGLDQWC